MENFNKTARKHKHPINKKISMKSIPEQLPGKPVRVRLDIEKETTTSAVHKCFTKTLLNLPQKATSARCHRVP